MRIWPVKPHIPVASAAVVSRAMVLFLLTHCLLLLTHCFVYMCVWGMGVRFMFSYVVFGMISSFAIISLRKKELVALLTLTHISTVSFLWNKGKQCRPRSDASEQGLHYMLIECSNKLLIKMKNTTKHPLKQK